MQTNSTPLAEESTVELKPVTDLARMPYIRVDQKGKILFANEASQALLKGINPKSDFIPNDFIESIPGMLNLNADFSVPVVLASGTVMFDVIGFQECGYIGLYGRQA
jgi:hypothetical protein